MAEEESRVDEGAVGVDREEVGEPAELPQDAAEWADGWYRLTADYGQGVGMMPAGTVVRVLGVYEPGTAGIGRSDSSDPLVQYVEQAPSGRWVPRNVHFTAGQFRQLFVPAQEPAQWQAWVDQQSGG